MSAWNWREEKAVHMKEIGHWRCHWFNIDFRSCHRHLEMLFPCTPSHICTPSCVSVWCHPSVFHITDTTQSSFLHKCHRKNTLGFTLSIITLFFFLLYQSVCLCEVNFWQNIAPLQKRSNLWAISYLLLTLICLTNCWFVSSICWY